MKVLKSNKFKVSAAVVVLVLGVSIGGTIAWLHKSTDTVRNSFDPGLVNVTIDENFEPGDVRNKTVVKQVRIKNSRQDSKGNGNLNVVPAYIRVQLVPTWVKDTDNETTGKKEQVVLPVDAASLIDYQLNLKSNSKNEPSKSNDVDGDWVQGDDGYYYFTKPVDQDKYTDYLLETVSGKSGVTFPQDGYLELNVLVDAIQATNTKAANDAWGNPTTDQGKTNIY